MAKKTVNAFIAVFLTLTTCLLTCTNAFAATFNSKTYIKEMYISYGNTEDEAKNWLKNNGYEVLDYNLNEGADATLSTKRAVYLGYKTTDKAEEAITDMRLMNMKGGYSVQDYQMLLDEQKSNIQAFLTDFIVAVNEYRTNYNNGQARAVTAHDMLNLLYDDDTQQYFGDLLLNRVKEEYSDEEYNALTDEEKSKIADMTTILMQGNADAILTIEQTIATATDDGELLWTERYDSAKTYDEMIEELMESKNLSVNQAVQELTVEYDEDAYSIASKLDGYKTYLENYTNADISFENTNEEIEAYKKANEEFDLTNWFAAGTQYELLKTLINDDISLYDLIMSDEYDLENADRYLLYPLVSVLTKGQRACLDFLPMYQVISLGINGDEAVKEAAEQTDINSLECIKTSVYDGIDRTLFSDGVALTGEAYKLQASTGKDAIIGWSDYISATTVVLYCAVTVSLIGTSLAWLKTSRVHSTVNRLNLNLEALKNEADGVITKIKRAGLRSDVPEAEILKNRSDLTAVRDKSRLAVADLGSAKAIQTIWFFSSMAMTCITVALFSVALWRTIQEIDAYYHAKFTPIPMHMINQSVDENNEKTYTYYTAVKCNRQEQNMVTDSTKLLGDFGDLNGDVGRQWIALYTTKDKAAGNPITTDLIVQYESSNLPDDSCTSLSMFCESVAQNLTNKKLGYTYADDKNGIYLFFHSDSNAYIGSIFTNGTYALIGGSALVALAVAGYFISKNKKKKEIKEN